MRQLQKLLWAFALGCSLALVAAYPSWGTSGVEIETITWEDLQPAENLRKTPKTDYERLPEAQLALFAELVRYRDALALSNSTQYRSEDQAEADRLYKLLKQQGVPIDDYLEQVEAARNYHWEFASQTNFELEGQAVRLQGYMLPIKQTPEGLVERFLLVPFVGACMHVPPPPPNQVIFVEPEAPIADEGLFAKVWLEGTIQPEQTSHVIFRVDGHQQVDVSYTIAMSAIEPVPYQVIRPETPASQTQGNWLEPIAGYSWWESVQMRISDTFTTTMTDIKEQRSWQALAIGLLVAFGYGILHTLGPGHGKAVIVSYFVGSGGSVQRGIIMGVRIAIFHVMSSIAIILITNFILRRTLTTYPASYLVVRLFSYAMIAMIGGWMLWQALQPAAIAPSETPPNAIRPTLTSTNPKADALLYPRLSDRVLSKSNPKADALLYPRLSDRVLSKSTPASPPAALTRRPTKTRSPWRHLGACTCLVCGEESSPGGWLSMAIGAVPCSGALLILLYGMANNMLWTSIAMVLMISLGMAITLSAIGITAIWSRNTADRRFSQNSVRLHQVTRVVRIIGTGTVCAIGVVLFGFTLWSGISM